MTAWFSLFSIYFKVVLIAYKGKRETNRSRVTPNRDRRSDFVCHTYRVTPNRDPRLAFGCNTTYVARKVVLHCNPRKEHVGRKFLT